MRALATVASLGRHGVTAVIEALIILAIVVTLALGAALASGTNGPTGADSVFAAKGGQTGGGGGKPPRGGATLSVTPDPIAAGGATYAVSGGGYGAGAMVAVNMATPGCCMAFNVLADSSGRISFEATTAGAGTYYVKTYRYGTTTLLASTSFTVK